MENMELPTKVLAGSNLPEEIVHAKPAESTQHNSEIKPQLSAGSFFTYYTWRGSGAVNLNSGHNSIRANSTLKSTSKNKQRLIINRATLFG